MKHVPLTILEVPKIIEPQTVCVIFSMFFCSQFYIFSFLLKQFLSSLFSFFFHYTYSYDLIFVQYKIQKHISNHNMHSLIEGKAYFYFHNIFSPEKINQSYLCPSFNNTQENSKKKKLQSELQSSD